MRTVALVVAIALGIAAAIGVRTYVQSMQQEIAREQRMVNVAVAARDVSAGEELTQAMVSDLAIPASSLTPAHISPRDIRTYIGRELLTDVGRHIPLRPDHFVRRRPRKASEQLPSVFRAVTVSVDATSGVAGLIRPGNRVDIHCTGLGEAGGRGSQETWLVLSDVTVLAVDSRMSDLDEVQAGFERYQRGYSTLTLQTTPQEAQLLIFLMNNARLTFTLRPEGVAGEPHELPPVSAANVRSTSETANRTRQRMLEDAANER